MGTRAKALAIMLLCLEAVWLMTLSVDPRARLRRFMATHQLTAATIAYGPNGTAPKLLSINAPPDRAYPYYSLSKPITSATVLALVDLGKIDLDEPYAGTSPRDLLRHAGGWDRKLAGDPVTAPDRKGRCVDIAPPPKQFAPGARQAYSNLGYCLLGRLIERCSGGTVDAAARRLVPATRAMAYDDWLGPAGGWSGTAEAYWRFASMPLDPRATRREGPSATGDYGLGWRLEAGGVSHFGQFGRGYSLVLKRGGFTAVALFDGNPGDGDKARDALRPILSDLQ